MDNTVEPKQSPYVETVIVGAGPAGLQLAYFLEKSGQSYRVLERAPYAGSLYKSYPPTGFLTTPNKLTPPLKGSNNTSLLRPAALKYDWNSLLTLSGECAPVSKISKDYHPDRGDYYIYLNTFAKEHSLKIEYGRRVTKIRKAGEKDSESQIYQIDIDGVPESLNCKRVVIATGVGHIDRRGIEDETKRRPLEFALPTEKVEGKRILLLGSGPGAAALAEDLTIEGARQVIVHEFRQKSREHFQDFLAAAPAFRASCKNATGGALSYEPMETIFLQQKNSDSPYTLATVCSEECATRHPLPIAGSEEGFDELILCTDRGGVDVTLFDFPVELESMESKYPLLRWSYEAKDHRNLFFIGSTMQGRDPLLAEVRAYRHAIEFLSRAFIQKKIDAKRFTVSTSSIESLLHHIIYRLNVAPELFNLGGQLADIFYYDKGAKEIVYFESVSPWILQMDSFKMPASGYAVILTLENAKQKEDLGIPQGKQPRLQIFKDVSVKGTHLKQLLEDFRLEANPLAEFTDRDLYYNKLVRIMRMIVY